MNTHVLPILFTSEYEMLINIENTVQSLLNMCLYGDLFFGSTETTHHSNIGVR